MKISYICLKSKVNINTVIEMIVCYSSVDQKRSEAEPSCVFKRSDASFRIPIDFKSDDSRLWLKYYIVL